MLAKCLAVVFLAAVVVAEIPSFVTVCGRRNPNLDKCVLETMDGLREKLKAGIPEIELPPQDPFHLDGFVMSDTDALKASARDVTVTGFGDFITKNVHVDLKMQTLHSVTLFKKVTIDADYDINSKILVPIVGRGPIHIVIDDLTTDIVMKYKLIKKNGVDYMFFTSVTTSLSIKDYTTVFTPSEGADSTLSTAINTALAGARKEILETLKPNFEKIISGLVLSQGNVMCKRFSYDELLPDRE